MALPSNITSVETFEESVNLFPHIDNFDMPTCIFESPDLLDVLLSISILVVRVDCDSCTSAIHQLDAKTIRAKFVGPQDEDD